MAAELVVCLKDTDGERDYKKKFLLHGQIVINADAPTQENLDELIDETIKEFGHAVDECKIKIQFLC